MIKNFLLEYLYNKYNMYLIIVKDFKVEIILFQKVYLLSFFFKNKLHL